MRGRTVARHLKVAGRWRVTFRPRIVNIIISYDEGGAHDTTQYMAMVKIEFRIFAQKPSWLYEDARYDASQQVLCRPACSVGQNNKKNFAH